MARIAIAIGMLVMVGSASIASIVPVAASPNRVTVTLSCDKDVSATAAVAFLPDGGGEAIGGVPDLRCGDDASKQVRVSMPVAVNTIAVTQFDITSAESTVAASCAEGTPVALPARVTCPTDGRGARLVVR